MKIHIKYMLSVRCVEIVRQILVKQDIPFVSVEIGSVETPEDISPSLLESFKKSLQEFELDIVSDNQEVLIEKIKNVIIDMIFKDDEAALNTNFSDYLEGKLFLNYNYMARRFTEMVGITIEKFIIATKVERIKSLLLSDDYTLSEISYKLNYSSVGHLSSQFKSLTGMTPSFFKEMQLHKMNKSN